MAAMNGADAARRAAAQAVVRVHNGGWANLTAKSVLDASGLNPRDRAFANTLFYGTVERLVTLDYRLAPLLKKPLNKLDVEVRAILETGLYQILYMNVPPRAAVDESVKLARALGKTSASGFVNAVLRRAAQNKEAVHEFSNNIERVCITWSVSEQVAQAVMQALPHDYDAFFEASFSKPDICLRVNTFKTTAAGLAHDLEEEGADVCAGSVPNALYIKMPGGVNGNLLFKDGMYHVQGEASQYACACVDAQQGHHVLDLCAAPGGKTATLAQNMGGFALEGKLTSCDVRSNRLPLIRQNLDRLGIQGVNVLLNDATKYNPDLTGQDRVLCDVPCSGLGVLAKKPDIRYSDGENFTTLPALQLEILRTAAQYVKQGGQIIYSTCTILPEENSQVVHAFLAESKEFVLAPLPAPPTGAVVQNKMVTLLPHKTGLDGFFVASLLKL